MWHLSSKYGLWRPVRQEERDSAVEFQKSKNSEIIYVSACESVYREIFITDRETVRLSCKPRVSRQNRET